MAAHQLPPLTKILPPGKDGANEFARIIRLLLLAEADAVQRYSLVSFDDGRGDIDGADVILQKVQGRIYVQIKYYQRPFSSQQKTSLKSWYEQHVETNTDEDAEFWLITPDEHFKEDEAWLIENFGNRVRHFDHLWINEKMLKYPHIGRQPYSNHNFEDHYRTRHVPDMTLARSYFEQFLDPGKDIVALLANAQPTLYDCKQVFTDDWAMSFFELYSLVIANEESMRATRDFLNGKEQVFLREMKWDDFLSHQQGDFPSGMTEMDSVIKKGTSFYHVSFGKTGEETGGYRLRYWCFINGRWVFFPKPYRAFRALQQLRANTDIKWLLKILRWSRIDRDIKKVPPAGRKLWISELLRQLEKGK